MCEEEKLIDDRHLERINRFTSIETGIYVEGELLQFREAKMFDNEVGIFLPSTFKDMKPEDVKKKYFSEQRPEIIKTNEAGTVNFSFSMVDREIKPEQLADVIQEFYLVLKRFQPMSVCLEDGTESTHNVPFAWMEFISTALDDNLFNTLIIYPVGRKLLMVMFSCPFEKRLDWSRCLNEIRKSITIYNKENEIGAT
jgi:hypothetical protein